MSRRLWCILAISAVVVASMMAIARPGGSGNHESLAHMITAEPGVPAFHAEIDADTTNNGGPCKSVDTSANVQIGVAHDIAVCLTDAMAPVQPPDPNANGVAKFSFQVIYNPALNSCVDKACSKASPCTEDDMPDANEGSTLGQGVPTVPDLGGGWSCNVFGQSEPSCTGGVATISCGSSNGPFPPTGPSVSFPLFVVTFTAIGGGVDSMSLANVSTYDQPGNALGSCNPVLFMEPELPCFGADVDKIGNPPPATSTPTATRTATPTATPCPDGICPPTPRAWTKTPTPAPTGTPTPTEPGGPPPPPPPPPPPSGGTMPQVVPPATGSGPDGIPWASTAVWLLAAAGAVSASLGGLYLRRAGHR